MMNDYDDDAYRASVNPRPARTTEPPSAFRIIMEGLGKSVLVFGCIILIVCLLTYPVKWSWNYVVPGVFGLKQISFLDAWCLTFLASIFFKGAPHVPTEKK